MLWVMVFGYCNRSSSICSWGGIFDQSGVRVAWSRTSCNWSCSHISCGCRRSCCSCWSRCCSWSCCNSNPSPSCTLSIWVVAATAPSLVLLQILNRPKNSFKLTKCDPPPCFRGHITYTSPPPPNDGNYTIMGVIISWGAYNGNRKDPNVLEGNQTHFSTIFCSNLHYHILIQLITQYF